MPPSSACTRARTRITTPASPQEMIAAGPATISASLGVNSQPEPMIDPIDAQVRPTSPTSRLRDVVCRAGAPAGAAITGTSLVLERSGQTLVRRVHDTSDGAGGTCRKLVTPLRCGLHPPRAMPLVRDATSMGRDTNVSPGGTDGQAGEGHPVRDRRGVRRRGRRGRGLRGGQGALP